MINHYNAFISYKHAPLDNKMAAHIQSALEHFKIPRKIQKQTGMKRIQRVFRDKDELPITSDLTDTISQALENSDYLIVICSKSTKQSHWVPREIEYFLRSHTMDHILTVLIEGEPEESIPDILCSEERVIRLEDGTVRPISVTCEPLSCDFRLPKHKADKVELPRLAACLIGCSYDELINRRRQYRIKRAIAAAAVLFTVAVAFAGYLLYNQMRLKRAYKETLISQAINFANQSSSMLENGHRVEAIQLALAALPPETDAPVTSEAVLALIDASYAYRPSHSLYEESPALVWDYCMDVHIDDMIISPDGKLLACRDRHGSVSVWNILNHSVVFSDSSFGDDIKGIEFVDNVILLVWGDDSLVCFNLVDREAMWKLNSDAGNVLYQFFSYDDFSDFRPIFSGDIFVSADRESFYISVLVSYIVDFSLVSKTCFLQISVDDLRIMNCFDFGNSSVKCAESSPDGSRYAFIANSYLDDSSFVLVLDTCSGVQKQYDTEYAVIHELYWLDNSRIVMYMDNPESVKYNRNDRYVSIGSQTVDIALLDLESEQLLWRSQFEFNETADSTQILYVSSRDLCLIAHGDVLSGYNCTTGEKVFSRSFNRAILKTYVTNDQESVVIYSFDGKRAIVHLSNAEEVVYMFNVFPASIKKVCVHESGTFVLCSNSTSISLYSDILGDENWEPLEGAGSGYLPEQNYILNGDYLVYTYACVNDENELEYHCVACSASKNSVLWDMYLEDVPTAHEPVLLDVVDDTLYLLIQSADYESYVRSVSLKKGKQIDDVWLTNKIASSRKIVSQQGNCVTYILNENNGFNEQEYLCLYDMETEEIMKFELPFTSFNSNLAPTYFTEANAIYYSDSENGDYVVYVDTGEVVRVTLPNDWTTVEVEVDSSRENWLISNGKTILVKDDEMKDCFDINLDGKKIIGMSFYEPKEEEKQILVVTQDTTLLRFGYSSGEHLGTCEVQTVENLDYPAKITYVSDKDLLCIQNDYITDLVDTESWMQTATVYNSCGYNVLNDSFFVFEGQSFVMGSLPHYSVEELIERAHKLLDITELSDEFKKKYDIN